MTYNDYAAAINKIFECLEKMKQAWPASDNLANIEKVEEYKDVVIQKSMELQQKPVIPQMEELGQ